MVDREAADRRGLVDDVIAGRKLHRAFQDLECVVDVLWVLAALLESCVDAVPGVAETIWCVGVVVACISCYLAEFIDSVHKILSVARLLEAKFEAASEVGAVLGLDVARRKFDRIAEVCNCFIDGLAFVGPLAVSPEAYAEVVMIDVLGGVGIERNTDSE
jgi:hypothetical protein